METSSSFEPYYLSPMDHLMPPIYMAGSKTFPIQDIASGVSVLENSIHRLVTELPFLSGNAFFTESKENANIIEVRPSNAEMLNDCPMLHKKVHPQGNSYVQNPAIFSNSFSALPLEITQRDVYPLIRFQANIMRDGIILTSTFFHPAMDGAGYFNILRSLASCCRLAERPAALASPEEQELIRRVIRSVRDSTSTLPNNEACADIFKLNTPCISRKLVFITSKLEQLRAICQRSWTHQATKISLSDVASAIIWLCVVRAHAKANGVSISPSKLSSMVTTFNTRPVLDAIIPQTYMGNATVFVPTLFPAPNMLEGGSVISKLVIELVLRVHRTRKAVDYKHVTDTIAQVNASHDWGSFMFKAREVGINNLRHTKLYEWDFGPSLGYIERFEMPDPRVSGSCWLLPARTVQEGKSAPWELSLALEEDSWVHLEVDPLIQWVTGRETSKL